MCLIPHSRLAIKVYADYSVVFKSWLSLSGPLFFILYASSEKNTKLVKGLTVDASN
jgi:hypothetical protein